MTYQEKLRSPKWQRKRLEIFQRDNFTCKACRNTEQPLHVHHKKYTTQNPWEELNENLVTLCERCHWATEQMKKQVDDKKATGFTEESAICLFWREDGYCEIIVYDTVYKEINSHISLEGSILEHLLKIKGN